VLRTHDRGLHENLKDPNALASQLDQLKNANINGFMTDVWWGVTERKPKEYDFHSFRQLVNMAKERGMQAQFVTSFHACGGNVGDACNIPLPPFVHEASGIWYKDQQGNEDKEYISLFADNVPVAGRTPVEMYGDWFKALKTEFSADMGTTLHSLQIGLGPAGELRYPAYQLSRWSFCGAGIAATCRRWGYGGCGSWAPPHPARARCRAPTRH